MKYKYHSITEGSDTLENFLSKVAFERKLERVCVSWKYLQFFFFWNKLSRLEHLLFLQVSFASHFRKRLSKENFLACHYRQGSLVILWLFLDPSNRLATTDMGRKLGGCAPFFWVGRWVPIWHNAAWAEAYLRSKWRLDPSIHNTWAEKYGLLCPPLFGGKLVTHLIQSGRGQGLPPCQERLKTRQTTGWN